MAIGLKGVRLKGLQFGRDDKGVPKVGGTYELLATNDRVLATQQFNTGYGSMEIAPSPATVAAADALAASVQADVSALMGLEVAQ